MMKKYYVFLLTFVTLLFSGGLSAQTTLNTTTVTGFANNNGSGIVTFNFQNTNSYDIIITDVEGIVTSAGANTAEMYIKTTPINGSPGAISSANGWTLVATQNFTGVGNTTTLTTQTFMSGISVTIPANTTYGMVVFAAAQRYHTMVSPNIPLTTVSGGGCNILMGDNISYGGSTPPGTPTFTPRGWMGKITFVPALPCVSPPTVTAATTTKAITCSGEQFQLGLSGASGGTGQTYQWQSSPDSLVWTNIPNATTISYVTSQTTTTYYRCAITCTATVFSPGVKVTTSSVALPGGTYTINGNLPTGGTNFATFGDFQQAIACGGIAGAVTVNVISKGSAYNEQFILPNVGGTSATNTITINGNGQTITFGGGANWGTMVFEGTQYVSVKKLNIVSTGTTNSAAVQFRNDARYLEFDSCEFKVSTTATSTLVNPIVASGSTTSAVTAGLNVRDLTIKNSLIEGGYYGMTLMGPTAAPFSSNNVIENNVIRDFYLYGIYTTNQENSTFEGNDINRATRTGTITTFYAFYGANNMAGVKFIRNKIHSPASTNTAATGTAYPIFLSLANATAANPMLIANNAIYNMDMNGLTYAIYISSGNFINFYHNTVSLDNTNATTASAQRVVQSFATTGTFEFKNNLFSITHGSAAPKHLMYFSNTVPTYIINHNQYHMGSLNGTNNFGFWGAEVTTFAAWQAVNSGAFDQNSVLGDPIFAPNKITPQSSAGNNNGSNLLASVPVDLFGTARTITPDRGAIEYTPLTCLQPLGVTGVTTATSATLSWTNDPDGDSVHVEYGPTGFNQGTGQVVILTGTSGTVTGLLDAQCYDFYITTYCNGVLGNGTALITLCTQCLPATMPYFTDFGTWPPLCWEFSTTGTWNWQHNATGYAFAPFWSFSTGVATMRTRPVNAAQAARVLFKWAHAYNTSYPNDRLVVRVREINTTSWDTIKDLSGPTFNSPNSGTTTPPASASDFVQENIVLNPALTGKVIEVEFIGITGFGPHVFVDDVLIEQVPSCVPPFTLTSPSQTSTSVQVGWNTISGTCFKVEYGPVGFVQGTGQGTIINNTTSPTTITGLSPNTFYHVYVADCCDTTAWTGPLLVKTNCVSQLSGTYTIGGPVGPNNFATLDSAINVLTGCGVSGPVTFNMAAGTYTRSWIMNSIQGASATNTITFNGASANTTTIASPAGTNNAWVFSGASHIKFQNVHLNAQNSPRAIWLRENANNLTFENCRITCDTITTLFNTGVILATTSETSPTTAGNNANNITVKNCKIKGGYYGISVYGPSASVYSQGLTVEDCEFLQIWGYAINAYYVENISVKRNILDGTRATFGYGYYGFNNKNFQINQNRFRVVTYGIYVGSSNVLGTAPTTPSEVNNNMAIGSGNTGIWLTTVNAVNVYHNSTRGNTYGMYIAGTNTGMNVRNNIFSGNNYAFYCSPALASTPVDYNIYHSTGTNFVFWGANYATLAAWKTAVPAINVNSLQGDPGYLDPASDLSIIGTLPNDVGVNGLATIDVFGNPRPASGSTIVDIGAHEFTPLQWDASLQALIVPLAGCGDSNMVAKVVVRNFGLSTITSIPATVVVSGGVTATINTTAAVNIPTGGVDTVTVGTFNTYNGQQGVNFLAYLSLVNDQKGSNDSATAGPGSYFPYEPVTSGVVDTICGSPQDSVELFAIPVPGATYGWYDAAAAGNQVGIGDTIKVPGSGQTTYWVQYESSSALVELGTGALSTTSTTITPYKTFYMDGRAQYMILASELQAQGVAGGSINSLAFEVSGVPAAQAMNDFTIKLATTTNTNMSGGFLPSSIFTTVYNANYTAVANWNTHTFTTPFIWNGSDNLVVEVCFDNNNWTGNTAVTYDVTPFVSIYDGHADNATASGCTDGIVTIIASASNRPRMRFNATTTACSQIRKPVSFALNPNIAVADFTFNIAADGATVTFNSAGSNGNFYEWDFGDLGTSTLANPTHVYTSGNTYTVCLITTDTVCNTTDTICKTVVATVGIEEGLLGQSLSIFPNPNTGNFRVSFMVEGVKNAHINVVNPMGQVVYTHTPGNISGEFKHDIDLGRMAAGVYIVQITTDDGIISRRVTVQK
jgi:hypothetical protein